jgi:3-hydroxyisobutyrate dehydrogenase
MASVAFLGLGVMGYPMAGHLRKKGGHDATVYNRTAAKAEKWIAEFGGSAAGTPREAAAGKDFVFSCVGNDDDLRQITIGPDGAFQSMKKGAIFIDNTTASAEVARELAEKAAAGGFGFLDAPVSGGQAGAENGVLTVMVGGEQAAFDIEKVIDVISKGAAGSWQMENRHKTMNAGKYDFGFAVDWMRKDLGICLAEANRNGAKLPVTALVDQFYKDVQAMDGRRWDTSSLLARLER